MKGATLFIVWLVIVFAAGCSLNFPSVCDNMTEPSLLCDIAQKYDVRLEDIGNALIVANAVAIGEGRYTREQAVKVLEDIRSLLEYPIAYAVLRKAVYERVSDYPGLFELADIYFGELAAVADPVYKADRDMLIGWIDNRVETLEASLK